MAAEKKGSSAGSKNSRSPKKASSEIMEAKDTLRHVDVVLPPLDLPHGALYPKYTVIKNETGEMIEDDLFILRPARDHAAFLALYEYARQCSRTDRQLSEELYAWLGRIAKP